MPDGKCRDENKNFFPIADQIHRTKGENKQNMIISVYIIQDVIFTQAKIQRKLTHPAIFKMGYKYNLNFDLGQLELILAMTTT